MGCFSAAVKYLIFIFNLLIVICGAVLIGIGALFVSVENNDGLDLKSLTSFSVGTFTIIVGLIIFFIAFLGCCGAIKENSCMLTTYAVILIVIIIIQVILGALTFSVANNTEKLDANLTTAFIKMFDKYNQNENSKKLVDDFQQTNECCGVNNYTYWTRKNLPIPDSCYPGLDRTHKIYDKGCDIVFQGHLKTILNSIGGVTIGFALVELACVVLACIVRNRQ